MEEEKNNLFDQYKEANIYGIHVEEESFGFKELKGRNIIAGYSEEFKNLTKLLKKSLKPWILV